MVAGVPLQRESLATPLYKTGSWAKALRLRNSCYHGVAREPPIHAEGALLVDAHDVRTWNPARHSAARTTP